MTNVIATEQDVEVTEPTVIQEAEAPSRDELKAKGWTADELASAEKHGLVKPKEDKKPEPKPEQKAEKNVVVPEVVPDGEPKKMEDKRNVFDGVPDFDLTPEQEKALTGILPAKSPAKALYFRMKNERRARQSIELKLKEEQDARAALESRLQAFENGVKEKKDDDLDILGTVEDDSEDKPLTIKRWREEQKREQEEMQRKAQEVDHLARIVAEAQQTQEEYARTVYEDFDEVVDKAKEVISGIDKIPEPWKRAKALKLFQDLRSAAAIAHEYRVDDYNGPMIAYEIGLLHPSYGKNADINGSSSRPEPKDDGGLTPEQMKRMEENAQRRVSSASVSGGSRKVMSADQVTMQDYARMTADQRLKFRTKYPERHAKLTRG